MTDKPVPTSYVDDSIKKGNVLPRDHYHCVLHNDEGRLHSVTLVACTRVPNYCGGPVLHVIEARSG